MISWRMSKIVLEYLLLLFQDFFLLFFFQIKEPLSILQKLQLRIHYPPDNNGVCHFINNLMENVRDSPGISALGVPRIIFFFSDVSSPKWQLRIHYSPENSSLCHLINDFMENVRDCPGISALFILRFLFSFQMKEQLSILHKLQLRIHYSPENSSLCHLINDFMENVRDCPRISAFWYSKISFLFPDERTLVNSPKTTVKNPLLP